MKNLIIISIFFNAYLFGQVPIDCYSSHITKIDDFYTNNTDFSDLEFLKKELKNKKIIVLGESGHGDGASFEAKTRLVKFLVEEMDYSTLAFEGGGFTEMAFASEKISSGKDAVAEIKNLGIPYGATANKFKIYSNILTIKTVLIYLV